MYKTHKWKDWISSGLNKVKGVINDPFKIVKYLEYEYISKEEQSDYHYDRYPKYLYVKFSRKNILSDNDNYQKYPKLYVGDEYYRMNVLEDFIEAYENKDIYCIGCKANFYYESKFIFKNREEVKKSEETFEKLLTNFFRKNYPPFVIDEFMNVLENNYVYKSNIDLSFREDKYYLICKVNKEIVKELIELSIKYR